MSILIEFCASVLYFILIVMFLFVNEDVILLCESHKNPQYFVDLSD